MKIRSVIFDLDGTLLDTIEDIADANNEMLRSYGYPEHPVEEYINWIGSGARKLVKASLPTDTDMSEDKLLEFLDDYLKLYEKNIAVKTRLYKGISTVLDYLSEKNIPMSINTNKPYNITKIICDKYLVSWSFRYIYGQNGSIPKKPDPHTALTIAKGLDIKPENILFIGDSTVDLKTAKNAGMPFLGAKWGYGNHRELIEQTGALKMVDYPSQIIEFIKA